MAMRKCVCGNNDPKHWSFKLDEVTRKVKAVCKSCGIIIEFGIKPRKEISEDKIEAKAEYEIRNGKHYLKIKDKFTLVGLVKVNKKGFKDNNGLFLRVMPA